MPTVASAGTTDASFLAMLRSDLGDYPTFQTETLTGDGATTIMKATQVPIHDTDPLISLTVSGTPWTIVSNRSALSGGTQVAIDYDRGHLFFGQAPGNAASISFQHYSVRYRDPKLSDALGKGLRKIFPKIGQTYTSVISSVTNQWEYALPTPDFNDPRTRILMVEKQENSPTETYHPFATWLRVGLNQIRLTDSGDMTPGTNFRITYWGPYRSLSDMEDQLQGLPILYAKYWLLSNKEIERSIASTASITQDAGANQAGSQNQLALSFLQEFRDWMAELTRPMGFTRIRSTYGV